MRFKNLTSITPANMMKYSNDQIFPQRYPDTVNKYKFQKKYYKKIAHLNNLKERQDREKLTTNFIEYQSF